VGDLRLGVHRERRRSIVRVSRRLSYWTDAKRVYTSLRVASVHVDFLSRRRGRKELLRLNNPDRAEWASQVGI
jgi:hypothetical protein